MDEASDKKKQTPLAAVFFDIDDTLYSTTGFAALARDRSIKAMLDAGLDLSRDEALGELREVIEEFSSNYEHHFDKLLLRVPQERYQNVNPALIVAAGMVAYHDTKYRFLKPFEDVIEVLKLFKEANLMMGIISSGVAIKQFEKIVRLGIHKYIDPAAIFIAEQVGFSKTNYKLYLKVCSMLSLDPKNALIVGDNPHTDIDPPNQIGMVTVLNKREGKYSEIRGRTEPRYMVNNFWDLHEIIKRDFVIEPRQPLPEQPDSEFIPPGKSPG